MPQIIKPTHFTTMTTQGEVTVNLNLTITLENGQLVVSADKPDKESPDYVRQLPDWEPVGENDLIQFGKDI